MGYEQKWVQLYNTLLPRKKTLCPSLLSTVLKKIFKNSKPKSFLNVLSIKRYLSFVYGVLSLATTRSHLFGAYERLQNPTANWQDVPPASGLVELDSIVPNNDNRHEPD